MKRIWTLFILLGTTAVFLAACGGSQIVENVALAEDVATAVDTAVTADEPVSSPIDTADLMLIGETGRPQFLNAYASW